MSFRVREAAEGLLTAIMEHLVRQRFCFVENHQAVRSRHPWRLSGRSLLLLALQVCFPVVRLQARSVIGPESVEFRFSFARLTINTW